MSGAVLAVLCAVAVWGATPDNPHLVKPGTPYTPAVSFLLQQFNLGYGIPTSYKDILPTGQVYWGTQTYLDAGAFDENGKKVPLDSMIANQERTLSRFGLNLYDGATWEIALGLWRLSDVAEVYERNVLYAGTTGAGGRDKGNPGGIFSIRAETADYKYGDSKIVGTALKQIVYPGNATHFTPGPDGKPSTTTSHKGPGALFYRMIGPHYLMVDPMDGPYANSWKYPWPNPDTTTPWNTYGMMHFNDWKPIIGENVWSAILGPIQTLALKTGGNLTNTTCGDPSHVPQIACDFKTFATTPPPVQLAISILPGLEALQSSMGSLFHCPWGSKITPYDPEEGQNVSNENNFSGYAALKVLQAVLANYTAGTSDELLQYATTTVDKLVKGLDTWFDSHLLSTDGELPDGHRMVYQGGHINSTGYHPVPLNTVGGIAVDCQTWGMTVYGAERMDKNHGGAGTAYNVWQSTKKYAGYYKNDVLAGVGYTSLHDNSSAVPNNQIWSAEWTFGAINMCQVMSAHYSSTGDTAKAQDLLKDAQSMYDEVSKPWPDGLQFSDGSYVYANKRFYIPWGWYSNPIGATCSTAWAVMQAQNYNPFEYGGGNKPALQTPTHAVTRMAKTTVFE